MKIIERRYIFSDDVRRLCIVRGWYTKGNTEQYDNMLKLVDNREVATAEGLFDIASDIWNHSNTDLHTVQIMRALASITDTHFIIEM
jgi:hypothetical protein